MKFPITEGQLTSLHSHVLSLFHCFVFKNMGTKARHQLDWNTYKPLPPVYFHFFKTFHKSVQEIFKWWDNLFWSHWNVMSLHENSQAIQHQCFIRERKRLSKPAKCCCQWKQSWCQFKIALGNLYLTLFWNSPCSTLKRFKHLKMLECDKILCKHSFKYTQTTLNKDLTSLDRQDWISLYFF